MIWEDYDDPFASIIRIDKSDWHAQDSQWMNQRKKEWKNYFFPRLRLIIKREYPFEFWCHDEELGYLESYFLRGEIAQSSVFNLLFLCWLHPNPTLDVFQGIKVSSECIWDEYAIERFYKLSFRIMEDAIWVNLRYKKLQGGLFGKLTIPLYKMLFVDSTCSWDRCNRVINMRELFLDKPKAPYIFGSLSLSRKEFDKSEYSFGDYFCESFFDDLINSGFEKEKRDDLEKYFIIFLRTYAYHGKYPLFNVERGSIPFKNDVPVQIEHSLCLGKKPDPHPNQIALATKLEEFLNRNDYNEEVKILWEASKEKFADWLEHPNNYIDGIVYDEEAERWVYP